MMMMDDRYDEDMQSAHGKKFYHLLWCLVFLVHVVHVVVVHTKTTHNAHSFVDHE